MTIAPIRTESDYDTVMVRIDEIWGSLPGTNAGDELEVLIDLAWVYEKKHHHIEPPTPLEILEYRLDQMGLNAEEIQRVMDFRRKAPEIFRRESRLSPDIINLFSGIPFEAFLDSGDSAAISK
jgi:HTH-type transcriptional regulator/antitoxin HigA